MEAEVVDTQKPKGTDIEWKVEYYLEVIGGGTRLAMPKTIYAPNTSLLKTGSGATEGVLD